MARNIAGGGAAISVLCRVNGLDLKVIDVGMSGTSFQTEWVVDKRVRAGTRNLASESALTIDECQAAVAVGMEMAAEAVLAGYRCVISGEMGIGNTTSASAVICGLGGCPPETAVGPGTGVSGEVLLRKMAVVGRAIERIRPGDVWSVLCEVGGLEMCALVGLMIGGAAQRTVVIVDGLIGSAAAFAAYRLCPEVKGFLVFGHRSTEPGHSFVLRTLGVEPVLNLKMRLGEGTGAALAYPVVRAAAHVLTDMATFDSAGVSGRLY